MHILNRSTLVIRRRRGLLLTGLLLATLLGAAVSRTGVARADAPPVITPSQPGVTTSPVFHLKLPDLKVTSLIFHELSTGPVAVLTVANTGNANAGPFRIFVKDGSGAVLQVFTPQAGIAAGAHMMYVHKLPGFTCGGVHTRFVVADATGVVAEWNEANNTATNTYIYPVC